MWAGIQSEVVDAGWRAVGALAAGVAGAALMMQRLWRWNKDFDAKQVSEIARQEKVIEGLLTTVERKDAVIDRLEAEVDRLRDENWKLRHPD